MLQPIHTNNNNKTTLQKLKHPKLKLEKVLSTQYTNGKIYTSKLLSRSSATHISMQKHASILTQKGRYKSV